VAALGSLSCPERGAIVRLLPGSSASAEPALTAEQKKTRALRSRLSGTQVAEVFDFGTEVAKVFYCL
jgi:hypothetical protein